MKPDNYLTIENKRIGDTEPTYFIADIAANHDGDLQRAVDLIHRAAEAGADAAKFQHFQAETIISDKGFRALGNQLSHQSTWQKTVFEVYKEASVDLAWTPTLKRACEQAGIAFFTTPYSIDILHAIDSFVPAYKIGSGDITWLEIIKSIAQKNKPYILATGASTMTDVQRAVEAGLAINPKLALLQCNTNYTASLENFRHIQLNVLRCYRTMYPEMVLGLSDHTPGHATVLGAVALGARIVEKHFTDDTRRVGPDHAFSMDPRTWREMIDRTRELEKSLGSGIKRIEKNEEDTVILQRRSIRLNIDVPCGSVLKPEMFIMLRPCPRDALPPYELSGVIGRTARRRLLKGDYLRSVDFD